MSKCSIIWDYDNSLNPIEPCESNGWKELDGLCINHYRQIKLGKAVHEYSIAENNWRKVRDNLYNVEVAAGLRAQPARVPIKLIQEFGSEPVETAKIYDAIQSGDIKKVVKNLHKNRPNLVIQDDMEDFE